MTGSARIVRANARNLPLADNSVDLVVTSPPYFALRSYQDGGEHYQGQIGDEPTPAEFVASLLEVTRECVRVLKPSGSLWVNLGDSYSGKAPGPQGATGERATRSGANEPAKARRGERPRRDRVEQFTREDAAWLAGVIDSDGSIGIHINKQPEGRSPSFVPWVRIGQMRPEVVERAAEICGTGKVMHDGRGVWNWSASAQQARWVLERIHPWLLIKKRQAWAAIEVAWHVEQRNAKGSWRQLTDDDVAYRQRLREAVMVWNKGGVDDLPVPDPGTVPLPIYPLAPRAKSLHDIPHAYALACVGELGLIKRAEVIWSKVNGLPESVTDRVRRSHEVWFHFTLQPRYFSAVDEIREPHAEGTAKRYAAGYNEGTTSAGKGRMPGSPTYTGVLEVNPLGKLPGSVWVVPTQPLRVPEHLGVDHFAAFPMAFPRRIIQGWSPSGVCTGCGEGRRPVVERDRVQTRLGVDSIRGANDGSLTPVSGGQGFGQRAETTATITGYACACPEPTAPTTPSVVLDPFGGTGTTALVAKALGRQGISVDMSADYNRLATWRTNDPDQLAQAMQVDKPARQVTGQTDLFDLIEGEAS
jgi:SAM-dependent methyltransferase